MARILSIANQKGGVGKTTTAINLGVALAKAGKPTLLIDLDPQCNATTGLGIKPLKRHPLASDGSIRQALVATKVTDLSILPGIYRHKDIEVLAGDNESAASKLRQSFVNEMGGFDFVLVDCPPSLGRITQTALEASSEVLMPVQCEYFAMEGLAQMIHLIRRVMQARPSCLQFGGVLLTMADYFLELTAEVDAEIREFFGEIVFDTVIPRDVLVAEAPRYGQSVIDYAPRAQGARAYVELCMEVLQRD